METQELVKTICNHIKEEGLVMVEISARHVHLTQESVDKLFGQGFSLSPVRELSQTGQYLCQERVNVIGPKGTIKNVAILGPCRNINQIELSAAEARKLGISAPVRLSGDIDNSPGLTICTGSTSIELDKGAIIAKRHIHITPEDAKKMQLSHEEIVSVHVFSDERSVVFNDTIVRVSNEASTAMHIDIEEANAAGITNIGYGLIKKEKKMHSLVHFISEACKKIVSDKQTHNEAKPFKNENKKMLISEKVIKDMIKDGSIREIDETARFTPLARDIYREYIRRHK